MTSIKDFPIEFQRVMSIGKNIEIETNVYQAKKDDDAWAAWMDIVQWIKENRAANVGRRLSPTTGTWTYRISVIRQGYTVKIRVHNMPVRGTERNYLTVGEAASICYGMEPGFGG